MRTSRLRGKAVLNSESDCTQVRIGTCYYDEETGENVCPPDFLGEKEIRWKAEPPQLLGNPEELGDNYPVMTQTSWPLGILARIRKAWRR